jgi:holliday junction DNA helicase RuvB
MTAALTQDSSHYDSVARAIGITPKPRLTVVNPEQSARQDPAARPDSVVEMVGQEKVRVQLGTMLRSAQLRDELPGHVLFYGAAGLGKTSLAKIVARETGGRLVETIASSLNSPTKIARELGKLERGDVLFIDEIHGLSTRTCEMLYTAMEDFKIYVESGTACRGNIETVELEPFVLIGATTDPGRLPQPLRDRFQFKGALTHYSTDELAQIITRKAAAANVAIDEDAAAELGGRSRGTPRIAGELLDRCRDYAITVAGEAEAPITVDVVRAAMALDDIDAMGLTLTDQLVLMSLCTDHMGGPVGINNLAASAGEENSTVREMVEPWLIASGLMKRTTRGRVATKKAYAHLGLKAPVGLGIL